MTKMQPLRRQRRDQSVMQVRAVHAIRELCLARLDSGRRDTQNRSAAVADFHLVQGDHFRSDRVQDAPAVKQHHAGFADHNGATNLAQGGRLFEDVNLETRLAKGNRGSRATDPSAHNRDAHGVAA